MLLLRTMLCAAITAMPLPEPFCATARTSPGPEHAATASPTVEALKKTELELANRLVEDYPGDPAAINLLANVYNNHGNRTDAVRYWERVVALDPNNAAAYDSMARVALLKEEHAKAALLWEKAVQIDPNMFGARFRLAHALMGMGKTRQAITTLKKDLEIYPKASWSYYLLGELYTQLKEYERAKQSFEAAIQIQPDYTKAYYGLATVCMRLKQPNEARKSMEEFKRLKAQDIKTDKDRRSTYDDLATMRPRVAETCNEAGRIYYMHGNMRKAEQLWRTAAATDPKNVACRTILATLYQQNNSVLQALQICEQLRELEPENSTRHFNVGVLNMRLRRFEAAEKAFLKARELAPQQSGSYRMLAQLYLEMGRRAAEAMALARQAVQLEPNAENYFVLGAVYADSGNLTDALGALRRAVELDPQNPKYRRIYELFQKRVQKEN